jgi:hypothetical protein
MSIQCPPQRESNREHFQTQRIHCCEFIPWSLLDVIRILARRSNGDQRLIIFGPEVEQMKKQAPITSEVAAVATDFASEANSINQMHRELELVGLQMFQIGERLARIREQLPHDTWDHWVDDHLNFTIRTAQRYLRAYKHRHLAGADPVLFLEQIQGKADTKNDTVKNDTGVAFDQNKSDTDEQPKPSRRSLHKYWAHAAADAKEAIEQLIDFQGQDNDWLGELTNQQRPSKLADCFLTITQLELETALGLITTAAAIDLPHTSTKN